MSAYLKPELIPLGLYIHVPWCVKKCPYCDFNSHEAGAAAAAPDYERYAEQLIADARAQAPLFARRQVSSVFIGGGTPSLMPATTYAWLLKELQNAFGIHPDAEVTLEANPGTLEHDPFDEYLKAGINRLSIGVQSFNDQKLKALGRIHGGAEAKRAVQAAQAAGFTRINIDLMHGLPNQTCDQALADLQAALDLGVSHLSWYQLTLEPSTVFAKRPPTLPVADELHQIQIEGEQLLRAHGFANYEVSAWTKIGAPSPSQHNLNYWRFGDYAAIGAGAHGKITQGTQIARFNRTRLPKDYLAAKFTQAKAEQALSLVSESERVFEFMLNALRLSDGVSISVFEEHTGLSVRCLDEAFERLSAKGLVRPLSEGIACTELGLRYLNQVLAEFID